MPNTSGSLPALRTSNTTLPGAMFAGAVTHLPLSSVTGTWDGVTAAPLSTGKKNWASLSKSWPRSAPSAALRVLDQQNGPTLLVGHSYGGVVITEAGNAADVVGLVYVAAFIPDQGESAVSLLSTAPAANNDMRATKDDFLYLDPAAFPADFAADLPPAEANFMAHSQALLAKAAGGAPATKAAWHQKKSWALVATHDHNINPDLERSMAKRAGSETIEVPASHAVYVSKPEDVARLIERAAKASAQ
jgi:pimeloyl-ACP methyl ester carboxylesterase